MLRLGDLDLDAMLEEIDSRPEHIVAAYPRGTT